VKTILITGSTGFIGKKLTEALTLEGHRVIRFEGDIRDPKSYEKLNSQHIDHCFHLAALLFVPDSWVRPEDFVSVNVMGTEKILEFCRKKQVGLTFMSSYLYGAPEYLPIDEKHPVQTTNPYALSKHLGEQLCHFYAEHFKMNITVLRPFNIYGPGQDQKFLIPSLISQFLSGDDVIKVMDVKPKRDYVYIQDVISAMVKTMINPSGLEIYNIGSGYSYSVAEVINEISKLTNVRKTIHSSEEPRPNEIPETVAAINKAAEKLNWHPTTDFRTGLMNILNEFNVKKD
jgi:GDP-4-dehydro-6-deoxy-D-mannose reductase